MKNRILNISACLLCIGILSGCVSSRNDLYYWGEYEQLVYDMYVNPGKADTSTQINKITADIQQAQNMGKSVPPGVYAHLGFMYAARGDIALAETAFNQEKLAFPESSTFIDGMMQRAIKNN